MILFRVQKHFKNFKKRAPGHHASARVLFFYRIPRANLYDGMRNKRKIKCVQPLITNMPIEPGECKRWGKFCRVRKFLT